MSSSRSFRLHPLCMLLALAYGPGPARAQGPDPAALDTVTVQSARAEGFVPRTVEAGTFRGAGVMDVPSTVNVITREVLELQGASGLYDAVRNTAGVTRQQNGGETWDQLVIRGMPVENRTNYRLNGSLPIMNFSQVPLENKERVEVLKGASALYYGFASPAGVVNFVTKRAGAQPVASLGLTLDQHGRALASADVGRRFGDEGQYGLRVNAAGGTLGSYLDGAGNGQRRFVSAAFDWRVNSRLTLKADLEYDRRKTTEQAGIALPTAVNGSIALPHPVDPRKLVGPAGAAFNTETTNAQVRADYALSDQWALTLEAGNSRTTRDRNLPIFRFANAAAVATGNGRITGNSQHLDVGSDLLRAELFGGFETAGLRHELTLGASRTEKTQDPVYQRTYTVASQNLYSPVPITSVVWGAVPTAPTTAALETTDTGLYAVDRIEWSPRWQAIIGVRHSSYRSAQGGNVYDVGKTTPMAALIHKLSPDLSVYASYAQGLEEGEAGPTGTVNQNVRLAPGVSRQKEVGLRWQAPAGMLVSAAVFDISRPGYYTNAGNVFVADGEQRYQGIELSAQGPLTRQLSWQTSAQWLDPKFRHVVAAYEGKLPENAAKQTLSAFLSYDWASLPGLSLQGGAYYTGRRPVDDLNQAWLGGVTLFALGARYTTRALGPRTTWQINVDNAADKRYWAGGGNRLAAGAPRTVKASVKVDL
ncbi:TonB-dependent siderophore receptor [Paracidovorax anthurii]|nr:TonB-dependent receptor [Paracidovorax anthurii]